MFYLSTLLIISLTNVYMTQAGFLDDFKQILIQLPHSRRENTLSVDPVNVGEPLVKRLQAVPVKAEKKHARPVHAKEEDSSSSVEIPVMRNHHKHHHESLVYDIDDPVMHVDMDWR